MYLFVYGTLKRGMNPMAIELWRSAEFMGSAIVEAALYDLGAYPGLVEKPAAPVHGELARLLTPETSLARLDTYEGPEFKRALLHAVSDSGLGVQAWAYLYLGSLKAATIIPSGRWPAAG